MLNQETSEIGPDRTCFKTVLQRCASDILSFRALALYFSRTEEKLNHWFDTQSISMELEGWREGQI